MGKYPEKIYLQWYGVDKDDGEDSTIPDPGDVTWCQDKIYDTDIEYVRVVKLRSFEKVTKAEA